MSYIGVAIFLLVLVCIFVRVWDRFVDKKVEYDIKFNKKKAFVGEELNLIIKVCNKKIIPLPIINIEMQISEELKFKGLEDIGETVDELGYFKYRIVSSLLFYEKLIRKDTFYPSKRGVYNACNGKVILGDFLGYTKVQKNLNVDEKLIVYPKMKPLDKLLILPENPQGEVSVKRWILNDPIQVIGSRKYNYNDSFNAIDWKATAKLGELYVKKFDFTSDPSIMIFLDVQTSKVYWQSVNTDMIEAGIEIAAAIAGSALKERIPVGYSANSVFSGERNELFIEPKLSSNQQDNILEALAKTNYRRTYSIDNFLNIKKHQLNKACTMVIILSYISKELKKALNYLCNEGYSVKVVLLNNNMNIQGLDKKIEIIKNNYKEELNGKEDSEICLNI